jgi:hypothetical protein
LQLIQALTQLCLRRFFSRIRHSGTTIQVPKDFYREKDLLTVFDGAMPGRAVAIERRNGFSAPIVFAVGITEKSGVFWNAKETLKRFLAQN